MEWSAVANFINPELLLVVTVCWVIGYILKQTPRVQDWTIIYIVTVMAIIIVVLTRGFTPESILQAILCAAVAVYGNQLVKQTLKGGSNNDDAGSSKE